MPIEFNCPFCQARIRVPDNAGGGKGRCPKCTVRITVPKKSVLKPIEELPEIVAPAEDEPIVLQEMRPQPQTVSISTVDEDSEPTQEGPRHFDPDLLPTSVVEKIPEEPPARIIRKPKKRPKGFPTSIVFVVLIALAIFGVVGYFVAASMFAQKLTGELIAGTSENIELSPVLIDKSRIKLPEEELVDLLKKLEHSPVPLKSNSIDVQLKGTAKGLEVYIAAGPQARFYRVNLQGNEPIRKYAAEHVAAFDSERTTEVDREVTAFFAAYQNVLAKQATSEKITPFRDALALPSLVRGLGHQLVAAYGRGLYRCVYEDTEGGLYFLLPAGIAEFELLGRTHADGRIEVPAEFRVKVQGEIALPKKTETLTDSKKSAKPKSKSDADSSEMAGEETGGEK